MDPRLAGKPERNDGSLPVMKYDYRSLPETTENIWHAQMAGWPRILTYDARIVTEDGEIETAKQRRNRIARKRHANYRAPIYVQGMGIMYIPNSGEDWTDEYPFASTVENAGSTLSGWVNASEQRAQAKLIAAFYRDEKALRFMQEHGRPFWFEVAAINVPRD